VLEIDSLPNLNLNLAAFGSPPSTSAGMNPALHHRESFNLQNECRAALAAAKSPPW